MNRQTRAVALVGILAGVAACSGNPFASGDGDPDPAGDDGSAGEPGSAGASVGDGGEGSGAGGSGVAGLANGGSAPSDGGAAPGSGGAADGAAGDGQGPAEPVFTVSKLIDDMEDGNATLLDSNGDWFVIKDNTNGTITPAKEETFTMTALTPPRGASTKAAVVSVSGFTGWGAALGFDFAYGSAGRQAIDLKEALAVRFWAKASKATTVRFQLPNADTDAAGDKCSGDGDNACNAHWTKGFKLDTNWQQTTILFSDLKQDLSGRHVPSFDKHHVYGAFFVIGGNQTVTVSIDDLELVH